MPIEMTFADRQPQECPLRVESGHPRGFVQNDAGPLSQPTL
jgi:hypothetical protein